MRKTERVKIWVDVLYSHFATFFGVKNRILSSEDTAKAVLGGKSLIRFGDGEFGIFKGKNIHYQIWSENLLCDFEKIKEDFEKNPKDCPYLLALPKKFMSCKGTELMKKRVYVSSWAQSRLQFKKEFDTSLSYGDSFLFEKKNREIYAPVFNDESVTDVIFVHNNQEYAKQFAKTYAKEVFFVSCSSKNAFESISETEKKIDEVIEKNKLGKNTQFVISAGPAGKVLVYKYSYMGYHCIDAGHCWDDPLESE